MTYKRTNLLKTDPSTLIGEILARLISQKNLAIFWIYFSESPFQEISRGLIFANMHLRKFRVD